jgi:hypothetical protein
MKPVSLYCLSLSIALVTAVGWAAPAPKKKATSQQILTWISEHLNQTVTWDDEQGVHHTYQYSIEFTGCDVTLTQIMDKTDSFTYGPFNLKYVVPTQIEASKPADSHGRYWISLPFLHLVPRHVTSVAPGSPEDKHPSNEAFELIYLPSQDLADREAHAWHDAAVTCGGKPVPENLY